mmetsp:Transcript_70455/g.153622  ORF Transcript_70455/g.153622 Transcript_70455/m.153622 type:complete len:179 (-) Transcript_70455:484-1020(-)
MPKRKLSAMDELRHLTRKQESLRIARQKAEIRVALDQDPSLCADILDFLKNRGVVIGQDTRASDRSSGLLPDPRSMGSCAQVRDPHVARTRKTKQATVSLCGLSGSPSSSSTPKSSQVCKVLDMATAKATPLPAEEGIKKTEMRALDTRFLVRSMAWPCPSLGWSESEWLLDSSRLWL